MMLAPRNVALRVNGICVKQAQVCRRKRVLKLIMTDPILGEFAVNDRCTLEILELSHPNEMRQRLPNGGWRKVLLRILIALLGSGVVRVVQES